MSTWYLGWEEAEWLRRSFYVDDLLTGGQDLQQAQTRKTIAQEIMSDATFELHKWHSNHPQLEDNPQSALSEDSAHPASSEDQTYAKQQLLVKTSESKLLGMKWDNFQDTITVQFPSAGGTDKTWSLSQTSESLRPPRSGVPYYTTRKANLPGSVTAKHHGMQISQKTSEHVAEISCLSR